MSNELENERQKNIKLINDLNIEKQKNINLNTQLNSYINMINQLNSKNKSIELELNSKNIQIQNLNKELNKLYKKSSRLEYCKPGEKIMAINIISTDHKVIHAISCKNTDIFVKLEEELYEEYPEYKEVNTYFTSGGNTIKRFKSIEQNNIKNHDKILLNIYE